MSVITQRGYFPHFQHVLQRADPLRQVLVVMRQVQRVQRQTRHGGQRRQPVGPTPGAAGWVHRLRARSGHQVETNVYLQMMRKTIVFLRVQTTK